MPNKIDRAGTFRGVFTDWGVSLTKNECPQFAGMLEAAEIWDEDDQQWQPWAEYEMELMGYFVLFSKDNKETLTCTQIKKALGWDGESFEALDSGDYSKTVVQFRVEEDTYEGVTKLKVQWIDEADASPGTSVKKLDAAGMKKLDARFASLLKKSAKPASAPGKVVKKPAKPEAPAKKKDSPLVPPAPPTEAPPAPVAEDGEVGYSPCTKADAWATVNEMKSAKVSGEKLAVFWLETIKEVTGQNDQEKVTPEQWGEIQQKVLDEVSVI